MASVKLCNIGEALLREGEKIEKLHFSGSFVKDFAKVLSKYTYEIKIKKPFTFGSIAEALEFRPPVVGDEDWELIEDGCVALAMYPMDELDLEIN